MGGGRERRVRIGDLRQRVSLQSPPATSDGMGGVTGDWTDEAEVWAAVWPVGATEQVQAAQTVMTVSHRVRIRYRSDLLGSWRVKFGTRFLAIVSIVNPNEAGRLLDLICKEAS